MSDVKKLRGQVRIAVKELLPEILTEVLAEALYKRLNAATTGQLKSIEQLVVAKLEAMDNRHKDVQSLILREIASFTPANAPAPAGTEEAATALVPNEQA